MLCRGTIHIIIFIFIKTYFFPFDNLIQNLHNI